VTRSGPPASAWWSLAATALEAGDPVGWFEPLYAGAGRDVAAIPWAALAPHPFLSEWLDAPVASPPGRRALVVGCGLGDDARAVARHGFEVTAVDVAPSAVRWAARRHRRSGITWRVLDVLDPAARAPLDGAFDLVVEVLTVPYLPGVVRDAAMRAIGALVAPGGVLVVVTLLATGPDRGGDGPPWPQAPSELAAYRAAGLLRLALDHPAPDPAAAELPVRVTFQRPRDPSSSVLVVGEQRAGPGDRELAGE
jgi:SAM-dependent methyltransferase